MGLTDETMRHEYAELIGQVGSAQERRVQLPADSPDRRSIEVALSELTLRLGKRLLGQHSAKLPGRPC